MHNFAFERGSAADSFTAWLEAKLRQEIMNFFAEPVARRMLVGRTLLSMNSGDVGLAQSSRRLHQRVQHRLQIEGRAADDLEHVGGGGLLLQRFAQLVEQPRILDRDHGLSGEVYQQLDLLVGEWPDLRAID